MGLDILINVRLNHTRIAFVKDGHLRDLKVERRISRTMVGSIYKGRVSKVIPGMQSAFVDLGLSRSGFLYIGDLYRKKNKEEDLYEDAEKIENPAESTEDLDLELKKITEEAEGQKKIEELIKEGQEIMVQVLKDPIGTKGARLTTHISLAGRFMVYFPFLQNLDLSRKISDVKERARLKKMIQSLAPKKGGIVLRTVAEGAVVERVQDDLEYLNKIWKEVQKSYEKKRGLGLVHTELDLELRSVRDLISKDIDKIYIDNQSVHKKVNQFISQYAPSLKGKTALYSKERPIFDLYDLDITINQALQKKIWLKSGGSIVFDEAEALVAVDVNTGRYLGKKDLEETLFNTNMEACKEIANQLRIRNAGGIIIIDFIDMEKQIHREQLLALLQEEVKKDSTKTTIVSMSDLGLVQMTRKRTHPSLLQQLCDRCKYCHGKGYVKSSLTVSNEIFRALERELSSHKKPNKNCFVHCHHDIATWIYDSDRDSLQFIEKKFKTSIVFKVEPSFHKEEFQVVVE